MLYALIFLLGLGYFLLGYYCYKELEKTRKLHILFDWKISKYKQLYNIIFGIFWIFWIWNSSWRYKITW